MLNTENIFKCPITGQKLRFISEEELIGFNQQIAQSMLPTLDGTPFKFQINGGLISPDERFIYPIVEDIYFLLPELVLCHNYVNIGDIDKHRLDYNKQQVKAFYDQIGWKKDNEGIFMDTRLFVPLRKVLEDYRHKCRLRVSNHIKETGTFMLDVASGPVQYPEYKMYSDNYELRVCVDLSLTSLKEAKNNLKEKGLYILGDITNLPFQDNIFDAVISLRTIFHVPREHQIKAFIEIHRVLQRGCNAVVIYSYGRHSIFMMPEKILRIPLKIIRALINFIKKSPQKRVEAGNLPIYFHAYSYKWIKENVMDKMDCKILTWKSVNGPFEELYIHDWLFGKEILAILFRLEDKYPQFFGKVGQFPLIVIHKN